MIIGIDAGNSSVKICGPFGLDKFSSAIGEYRERNLTQSHGPDDMVFEYQGKKGFAGTLAEAESEFGGSMMGDSKAHSDTLIRVLLALHRQHGNSFDIVVGQPIRKHTDSDKKRIKQMLLGTHEIVVNGKRKHLNINRVQVAAEGGAAFWSSPVEGKIRIIDVGSATVNCATLQDGRYIDKDSFTLPFGCNTTKSDNIEAMVRGIVTHTSKKWDLTDTVYVTGGVAEQLVTYLRVYYSNTNILVPEGSNRSIYANAIGFYKIGCAVYA